MVVAALGVLLAVFGLLLPMPVVTVTWVAVTVGLAVLGATAFAPSAGVVPTDGNPWPWAMMPMAYGYPALVVTRASRSSHRWYCR